MKRRKKNITVTWYPGTEWRSRNGYLYSTNSKDFNTLKAAKRHARGLMNSNAVEETEIARRIKNRPGWWRDELAWERID